MKLLIISNMSHYRRPDGTVVGWGPTVQEIDELSRLFDEVRHVAVLHPGPAPASALPYRADNVVPVFVPPSGGDSIRAKTDILRLAPTYLATCLREARRADAVHVRCPANIPLLALLLLTVLPRPKARWVKYAGNWRPTEREALGYRVQRWWLRHNLVRGDVTVNGRWPRDGEHVVTFYNPTLTELDLDRAGRVARKAIGSPLRLLFVGRIEEAKGAGRVIDLARELRSRGVACQIEMVGDGPARRSFEEHADRLAVADAVVFHGWLNKLDLAALYQSCDFFVLPTTASEGLPKVVCEALACRCLPITSSVSSLRQLIEQDVRAGVALDRLDAATIADTIEGYVREPTRWRAECERAAASVPLFSYEHYLDAVIELFGRLGYELSRRSATRYPAGVER